MSGSSRRWSASNRTSSARLRALLRAPTGPAALSRRRGSVHPAEVVPGPRVDLDLRTRLKEERHLDLVAGLDRRRLGPTGRAVTLQAGLGVRDLQDDGRRQFDVQRGALVQ